MKAKKVNYLLIPGDHPAYGMMREAINKWHSDLHSVGIALAWRISLKPDVDGRLVLGKCVKSTDLNKEFYPFDFVILLNREVWESSEFDAAKQMALLDHELCHVAPKLYKKRLTEVYDERGRQVWRIRKHDIEEFREIVERHGCYKRDLERFAEAIIQKQKAPLLAGTLAAKNVQ